MGDIWLAGVSGDCSHAGTCPDGGPCGDGENVLGDCPDPWEDTASYDVRYTPGDYVYVGGKGLLLGQTIRILRPVTIPPRNYSYPVEIFRPANVNAFDPADCLGAHPTIAGLPGAYSGFNRAYTKQNSTLWTRDSNTSYRMEKVGGAWRFYYFTTVASLGFSSTGITFTRTPGMDAYGWGPASGSGTITYATTPPAEIPDGILKWGVEQWPGGLTLFPPTPYESIPLEAGAAVDGLFWGTEVFKDVITVVGYPPASHSGKIGLTLRSACVNPPP